jgi:hypothetical protein
VGIATIFVAVVFAVAVFVVAVAVFVVAVAVLVFMFLSPLRLFFTAGSQEYLEGSPVNVLSAERHQTFSFRAARAAT